jgi:Domain of unknown function (DUF5668)
MRGDRTGIRAVRGPIILITLGVLFALQSFNIFGFDQTWPVLLIVIGLLHLFGRVTSAPPPPPPPAPMQAPPNYNWQQPAGYRGPSYSQSPYSQPAAPADPGGAAKGGFGTTAPPRDTPPSESNPGGAV